MRVVTLILFLAVALSGCTTMQSAPHTSFSGAPPQGVTYFLPMRMVKLTVTREQVTLQELLDDRDKKVVELAAARTVLATSRTKLQQTRATLNALPATASARAEQTRLTELAIAEEAVAAAAVEKLAADVADLTRGVEQTPADGGECRYNARLELLPVQADPRARYVVDLRHSGFRDDTHTLTLTPAGLLSTVNAVSVDQTGQILVELARSAGMISGLQSRGESADGCGQPASLVRIFDPVDTNDMKTVETELQEAGMPIRLALRAPTTVRTGFAATPAIGPNQGLYYRSPGPIVLDIRRVRDTVAATGDTGDTGGTGDTGDAEPDRGTTAGEPDESQTGSQTVAQIYKADDASTYFTIDSVSFTLPQAGPDSYLPLPAGPFVRTANTLALTDGALSSWTNERPSEVLSVVRIPGQIVEAFIDGLGRVLTARIDISTKEQGLQAQELESAVQAERTRLLLECIARAHNQQADTAVCLPEE